MSPPSAAAAAARYARFAWFVLAYNLFVIVWGAFVRATGSGAGCGSHWPLCNGEVVPRAPSLATLIELGHRITSGVALILVAALVIGAWRRHPAGHIVRRAAATSGVLLIVEALIGAGLVLLEYVADDASVARGFWVSGHLINTFLLVASLTLTAWWASGMPRPYVRGREGVATALVAALLGVLVLGTSGAVTALGDTLFPAATLAEAKAMGLSETAHVFVRLRVWHPLLAGLVGVLIAFACFTALRARGAARAVRPLVTAVVAVYAVQLVVGALNVWLLAPLALQLVHLLLSDAVWIALVLLTAATLSEDAAAGSRDESSRDPSQRLASFAGGMS